MSAPLPPLEALPPVHLERIEVLELTLPLATPLRSAASERRSRRIALVHVVAAEAEGWAECVAEVTPTYDPETVDLALEALATTFVPLLLAGPADIARFDQGAADHPGRMAKAAAGLALVDAQLRAADRSLASWLGATAASLPAGAALGLHADVDDLLAEAEAALAAGAARLRIKIAPGLAAGHVGAVRRATGGTIPLQADANGTFDLSLASHLGELDALDELGLACLEQPLPAADLVGAATLADRLTTPICLDEPLTSVEALDAAIEAGACEVACLKPARVGGWANARRFHDRCVERGIPVWVGGMLETGLGRAANAAVAALPGMALAPDLDPRGRFDPDLTECLCPVDGRVPVPDGPGTGVAPPSAILLREAQVVGSWTP